MKAININEEIQGTKFLTNRTPHTTLEDEAAAFASLAAYNNGGIFAGGFAGESCWERHPGGDEIVHVLSGSADLIFLDGEEQRITLCGGTMTVVPKGVWHRFEAPEGVTLVTVTPEPTETSITRPA